MQPQYSYIAIVIILGSGAVDRGTASGSCSFPMEATTPGSSKRIKLREVDVCTILTGITTRACSVIILLMDMGSTLQSQGVSIRATGRKISGTAWARKLGLMGLSLRGIMSSIRSQAMASSSTSTGTSSQGK